MLTIFRRAVAALFLATILLVNAISHAEVKIYVGEGSYTMSDVETLEIARERAKADAIQNAREKAIVDVRSYLRSKNVSADDDLIETMTKNILKLVEEPHFYPPEKVDNERNVLIRVTVKAQIDDSDIMRWRNRDYKKIAVLIAQTKAIRDENEKQNRNIAELRKELAHNPNKKKLVQKFEAFGKKFLSNKKVEKAYQFYSNDDYNSAINLCNEALSLNPNNALAYCGCGTAYSELGQNERAIQDYDKAIELNPNYATAYNNRGESYRHLGQYERAIQDYDKAIELNPNDDYAYNNRGISYNDLGQYERAIQDYDKAIELNPNFDWAYNNRGVAYQNLGQYERAIQDYDKAIELNPNLAMSYNNRGADYKELGQYERAMQDYDKAIESDPKYVYAYGNRGEAYYDLKNYKQALVDLNKSIELGLSGKDLGEILYYRGLCYQATGNKSKAKADFAKAKELGYTE